MSPLRFLTLAVCLWLIAAPAGATESTLTVADGDTFGATFRLHNWDTPERGSRAQCPTERILAGVARRKVQELLKPGLFRLTAVGYDPWGRIVADVWVGDRLLGEILAASTIHLDGRDWPLAQLWPEGKGPKPRWCP